MSNWKKDLDKIAENLNIKPEGGKDEGIRTGSVSNTSNRASRIRGVSLSKKTRKNLNKTKGGEFMITIEGALTDIDALIKEAEANGDKVSALILKGEKVLLKLLSTMRSNQLLTEADKKAIADARKKRKAEREAREAKK